MPRTSPSELTISLTTRPQPPCRLTRRRNAVSVMPAMGAIAKGDGSWRSRIFIAGRHVGRIHLHAHALADQVHRQDRAAPDSPCASDGPTTPFSGPWTTSTIVPVLIVGHGSYGSVLVTSVRMFSISSVGHRHRRAVHRDDRNHAGALQDRQARVGVELREDVPGKQRDFDLLATILPPAPLGQRRQKRGDLLLVELRPHDLLVPAARPDREPAHG